MSKSEDTLAILKLYELRRDEQMRAARAWYFSEFAPTSAMDIIALYRGGELLLGVISHEHEGVLRVRPEERALLDAAGLPYRVQPQYIEYAES